MVLQAKLMLKEFKVQAVQQEAIKLTVEMPVTPIELNRFKSSSPKTRQQWFSPRLSNKEVPICPNCFKEAGCACHLTPIYDDTNTSDIHCKRPRTQYTNRTNSQANQSKLGHKKISQQRTTNALTKTYLKRLGYGSTLHMGLGSGHESRSGPTEDEKRRNQYDLAV